MCQVDGLGGKLPRHGLDALPRQFVQVGLARDPAAVDPQHHGRLLVVGSKDCRGGPGPLPLQRLVEPLRMARRRRLGQVVGKGLALPQETPQHRVGHSPGPVLFQDRHGPDGGGHRRVIRYTGTFQLIEPAQQQALEITVLVPQGLVQQLCQQSLQARRLAQRAVTQLLQQTPLAFGHLGQPGRQGLVE